MRRHWIRGAIGMLVATFVCCALFDSARAEEPTSKSAIDFARDIRPIFAGHCYDCHGPDAAESGLRLHAKGAALQGGDRGPSIVPGKAAESRLIRFVTGAEGVRMPPEGEGKPLTEKQIALLQAWIDDGARWPEEADLAGEADTDHWTFQPIERPAPPRVSRGGWVENALDAFVLARLEAEQIEPSPAALRTTLIRRAWLDTLGLPPTPEAVEEYLADRRPGAHERMIDRLLASPHYGERWGRHWLDLARYADSDGYEKDRQRPHAWRYRHWVIRALNEDVPFDDFTILQLAGDLLENAEFGLRNAESNSLVATGFHRNTLTNREGGIDPEEDRVKQTVDRTNTTGTVWLGLTVGCAQCHSHKYDPLSQREYYRLYAFFNSLREVDIPAPISAESERKYQKAKAAFDRDHARLQQEVAQYIEEKFPARQAEWESKLSEIRNILAVAPEKRTDKQRSKLTEYDKTVDPELAKLNARVAEHAQAAPKREDASMAQTLAALPKPRQTHVLVRGDFLRPGAEVTPGTPEALPPLEPVGERPTRLDFARWLVDPANPLTARVQVNRVWQRYFGRGLVETSHDFGTQGSEPSHPELLDWLASELFRQDWSLKRLHRLILTSATYRQSAARPELKDRDPYNKLLARQNRLRVQAEIVRDLALAASGLLEPRVGGPSVRPPQPEGVASLGYANSVKWPASKGADRYRRGVYTFFQRTVPYPMFVDFDAPDSNVTCVRRERSNTPLSALTLQNDPVFVECSQAFARRILKEVPASDSPSDTRDARVRQAFRLALSRDPSDTEHAAIAELYDTARAHYAADLTLAGEMAGRAADSSRAAELAAWSLVGRTLMNLDEFITRE